MPDPLIEIPDRAAFKASEVCEIAQIPSYVLRSWEKEFPGLGVSAKPGGQKIYRRSDIEQVLRIKQLLFAEGLTLAGARRKLEGEPPTEAPLELPMPEAVKQKVGRVRQELRSLLDLLGPKPQPSEIGVPAGADSGDAGIPPPVAGAESYPSPVADPTPSTWPPASRPGPEDPPSLPLLDSEAEISTQPPAAGAPTQRKRRGTRR